MFPMSNGLSLSCCGKLSESVQMKIAYTMSKARGGTNLALAAMVEKLIPVGCAIAGTIQIDTEKQESYRCDMDVKVLPDGPVIRISQSLGKSARGCRLDPNALEEAVGLVDAHMTQGKIDLLVVNKFGKHEAEGRGFRDLIGAALEKGIPVIVGLNEANRSAFLEFADGLAESVLADPDVLTEWVLSHTAMADALR